MPGIEDRCRRDLGLCATEGTLILHFLNNNLHHLASLLGFYACCTQFYWYAYLYLHLFFPIAAYCSPPNNPVNGTVHSVTGTKLGSTLRFSCDQGFRLVGQSSATCTRTAQGIYQWNAPVPLCQGEDPNIAAGNEKE